MNEINSEAKPFTARWWGRDGVPRLIPKPWDRHQTHVRFRTVFWHRPQLMFDRGSYLDHLADFHRTLASNKPSGFQRSVVFRISGAKWLNTTGEAYEEWYLLDDSAAMDRLNEAAVSGVCEMPHNKVARGSRRRHRWSVPVSYGHENSPNRDSRRG